MLKPLSLQTIPAQAEQLRAPVRAFLDKALTDMPADQRARSWLGFDAGFSRQLGQRGWIGLALPKEYGGGGRDHFARFVLVEELLAQGAPVAAHWIAERQSAQVILRYGTEAQKRWHIPRICQGESFFGIGMSEPQSGSDLASVRSRAERVGDGWRLNGQKIWTTHADECHYIIALVRTSGNSQDRHQGLSQFLIDMRAPGVTVRPIEDLTGDRHFSEVFFDDVPLPADALLGEEGSGWEQVTAELGFERSGPERIYSSVVLLDAWLAWLRSLPAPDDASITLIGRLVAQLATLRSMSVSVTARLIAGDELMTEAALVKDLGTTFEQEVPATIADLVASAGVAPPPELLRTLVFLAGIAPTFSLRGGTREILRGIIARGLDLR